MTAETPATERTDTDLLSGERWENTLDDAWPRAGGRTDIIRVLAREIVSVLAARAKPDPSGDERELCGYSRDGLVCIHYRGHGVPDGENIGRHHLVSPAPSGAEAALALADEWDQQATVLSGDAACGDYDARVIEPVVRRHAAELRAALSPSAGPDARMNRDSQSDSSASAGPDEAVGGGCAHQWLDRPESDTRECLICGTEVAG